MLLEMWKIVEMIEFTFSFLFWGFYYWCVYIKERKRQRIFLRECRRYSQIIKKGELAAV